MVKRVILAEGDGIGTEVIPAAVSVVNEALKKYSKNSIEWVKRDVHNLTDELLNEIKNTKFMLKGPTTTPVGSGRRSINVELRQKLDLYACVRPVCYFKGLTSPLKRPEDVNMVVFRENTEDVYSGIEWNVGTDECTKILNFLQNEMNVSKIRFVKTSSIGIKNISIEGSERLVRSSINYAIKNNRKVVTIIHKGNIMKFTEGLLKKCAENVAINEFDGVKKDNGDIVMKNGIVMNSCIADNFFQQALINPKKFSVVVATNLNGDYVSDALAAEIGGIGVASGANINYETGIGVFEATHGSAPDIQGKNIANPTSVILSSVMMLQSMDEEKTGQKIQSAVQKTISDGFVTKDLYDIKIKDNEKVKLMSTTDYTKKVTRNL